MKLIRFGEVGKEKPGVIIDEDYFDVSALVTDYNEEFFAGDGITK
ncbi:MAG: ureidoglycolate lyase, partial [Chitinophagaceae bacterium]